MIWIYWNGAKRDPKGFATHLSGSDVIDEIQRLLILTIAVKYAMHNEKARYQMTGSINLGHIDAAADTLAGVFRLMSPR